MNYQENSKAKKKIKTNIHFSNTFAVKKAKMIKLIPFTISIA